MAQTTKPACITTKTSLVLKFITWHHRVCLENRFLTFCTKSVHQCDTGEQSPFGRGILALMLVQVCSWDFSYPPYSCIVVFKNLYYSCISGMNLLPINVFFAG